MQQQSVCGAKYAIGDSVQWSPQGVHQFTSPAIIEWVSGCGNWVRVRGSTTGIPVSELSHFGVRRPSRPAIQPAGPHQQPTGVRIRMPNEVVGKILDHGSSSSYALQLLAYSMSHGRGFTLNEHRIAKPYHKGGLQMGERKFRGGLKLLKDANILERKTGGRRKGGRGAFARDTLLCEAREHGYVAIDERQIYGPAKLLAFVVAVRLNPFPRKAADVAKRIGVKGSTTIKSLISQAVAGGHINAVRTAGGWIVARPEINLDRFKNVGVENVGVENVGIANAGVEKVATHRIQVDDHSQLSDMHSQPAAIHSSPSDLQVAKMARARSRGAASQRAVNEGSEYDQNITALMDHVRKADVEKMRRWAEMAQPTGVTLKDLQGDHTDGIIAEVRNADVGKMLAGYLLTAKGFQPLMKIIDRYGPDAIALLGKILRHYGVKDEHAKGCWTSWNFLAEALASGISSDNVALD